MSNDVKMDVSIWEKLGDGLSAFSEGFSKFLTRLFGSSNERYVHSLGYVRPKSGGQHSVIPGSLLDQVNQLEDKVKALDDEQLKSVTAELRGRLAKGATLEDLLPEAFAACR